jgi:outer membrane protein TolC
MNGDISLYRHILLITTIVSLVVMVNGRAANAQVATEVILERLAQNPTIEQVQQRALEQARLEPRRTRRLASRVRWAGIFPRVEGSVSRGLSRDEDLDRSFQEMDELSFATDQDLDFRLSLRWDLDRLVYDPEELRVHRQVATSAQRRRELLLSVTRMYYELLLLRVQQELSPPEQGSDLERAVRIVELRSILDGLTGGLFSGERGSTGSR